MTAKEGSLEYAQGLCSSAPKEHDYIPYYKRADATSLDHCIKEKTFAVSVEDMFQMYRRMYKKGNTPPAESLAYYCSTAAKAGSEFWQRAGCDRMNQIAQRSSLSNKAAPANRTTSVKEETAKAGLSSGGDCVHLRSTQGKIFFSNRCTEPLGVKYSATGPGCKALPTGGLTPFEGRKDAQHLKNCSVDFVECTSAQWMATDQCILN